MPWDMFKATEAKQKMTNMLSAPRDEPPAPCLVEGGKLEILKLDQKTKSSKYLAKAKQIVDTSHPSLCYLGFFCYPLALRSTLLTRVSEDSPLHKASPSSNGPSSCLCLRSCLCVLCCPPISDCPYSTLSSRPISKGYLSLEPSSMPTAESNPYFHCTVFAKGHSVPSHGKSFSECV